MDVVSPLSLLEVTMGEEIGADDDCIIIEDSNETPNNSRNNSWDSFPVGEKMEVEVDPLFVGTSAICNDKQDNMPTLWVTTNITNLAGVPSVETVFRKIQYSNVYEVLTEILHCTICLEHVGCDIRIHPSSIEHPVLRVLICQHCACMYKTVNFIMNRKGKEINCRWCGKNFVDGRTLRTCQQCPFSFCEVCLQNNCPDYLEQEPSFPWTCIVCNMKVLWPARATLWALHCLKSILLANPGNDLAKINGDISLCCKNRKRKKNVVVNALQSLNVSDGLDLDQLVPPHLLNGATDVELYRTQLPEAGTINSSTYPTNQNLNFIQSKAKPRPKSKMKPKPKPKNNTTKSTPSVPSIVSTESLKTLPSETKKPHWLRPKLIGYINDFDQLRTKIEDIERSLDFDENDPRTEEKVDNVTTLLSLHRELLNSCRLSLINEWKERKARAVLENYKSSAEEIIEIKDISSPKVVQDKVIKTKVTKSNNKKKQNNKADTSKTNYVISEGSKLYPIKDCFVRLEKVDLSLLNFNQQIVVKQEKH